MKGKIKRVRVEFECGHHIIDKTKDEKYKDGETIVKEGILCPDCRKGHKLHMAEQKSECPFCGNKGNDIIDTFGNLESVKLGCPVCGNTFEKELEAD